MATHEVDPAVRAMALLVQPLVPALVSGGGLSRTTDGGMLLTAARGLGSAIAQGEVVPDRYELDRDGGLKEAQAGRKYMPVGCIHGKRSARRSLFATPCLDVGPAAELGRVVGAGAGLLGRRE